MAFLLRFNSKVLIFSIFILIVLNAKSQKIDITDNIKAQQWVDSVYNSLTAEEKIGQLIFVRANYSGQKYIEEVENYIMDYNIGGIVFFRSDPISQAIQTNYWNSLAKTPLMIAIDAEWGIGMRLSNTVKYPLQMALGATSDEESLYKMGRQIAEQCRRMGIQMNFAPVVDVNSNSANPVIGMRSFGENPEVVGFKASKYMHGLQDGGVIACAKHFPGHGDTKTDSHLTLPLVTAKKKELRNMELVPFEYLIDQGVASIMTAHLSVPALDRNKRRPTSLSYAVVSKLLKHKMEFKGLIITDGLDMKGVTKYYEKGEVAREAFEAGNDILLIPDDVKASVESILKLINKKPDFENRLEESCKKVLKYKYLTGAYLRTKVDTANLISDLNKEDYLKLSEKLGHNSITLIRNNNDIIPISHPDTLKTSVIVIGYKNTRFEKVISEFMDVDVHYLDHNSDIKAKQQIISEISDDNLIIVALTNTKISASKNFGISDGDIQFINNLSLNKKTILSLFASPYALNFFPNLNNFEAVTVSYQDKEYLMKNTAEIILGMSAAKGKLPVSAGGYKGGYGIETSKTRITYANPKELEIDETILYKIDSVAENAIDLGAMPGCQILAIKDGYIFYDKCFGYHTYDKKIKVKHDDIYDLASLTKILATVPSLMKIYEDSIIDINKPLSDYILYLKKTNKRELTIKEILSHQAGLESWIPYYKETLNIETWDTAVYRSRIDEQFPVRVAQSMYINEYYDNKIYDEIAKSPLGEKEYQYSDLGFYLFRQLIELATNSKLNNYVLNEFYSPLGLKYIRYKPLDFFDRDRICPTENDKEFRFQTLQGDVHDQGAAMLGGVSGHAGLFSNAYDVGIIMQMFLDGGSYGGRRYMSKQIVDMFTTAHFTENENRRGLGFDKPLLEYEDHGPNCKSASPSSFGHSGFTGTYAWADPENNLIYVFISNRVYPDMDNNKLGDLDIRTNIHQFFYDACMTK